MNAAAAPREPSLWLYAAAWVTGCLLLLATAGQAIATFDFPDPDDTMRLMQVRDWLAGQGWYDVTQYRLNGADGFAMHWSRLVDLPIAAIILVARPFVSQPNAEWAAMVIVPLLTLGVVMALVARLTERLLDRRHALLGAFLLPVLAAVTVQLQPMRIDHHGWQLALAATTMAALIGRDRLRSGLAAGALIALWLHVSLEGLPLAVAAMALLALRWMLDPREATRFGAAMAALAVSSVLLYALTRDPLLGGINHCDAVSPVHLLVFGGGAAAVAGLTRVKWLQGEPLHGVVLRAGALALTGLGLLAIMLVLAPTCVASPFAQLPPLVHEIWYQNVREGQPIWQQSASVVGHYLGVPLVGLFGTVLLWQRAEGEARATWGSMLFMLIAATLVGALVLRAGGVAILFAIPGAVWLFRRGMARAAAMQSPLRKAGAATASLLLLVPGQVVTAGTLLLDEPSAPVAPRGACPDRQELTRLNALPAAIIAAPLDISPAVVEASHHRAIAAGYHRNGAAMLDVMHIYTLPPEQARALLHRRGAQYIAICPSFSEVRAYARHAPAGLWAQVAAGHAPAWLEPVALPGVRHLQIWRVR